MYQSKAITGLIPLGDFIRMEAGSTLIYEVKQGVSCASAQAFIQSYVTRVGGKIEQRKMMLVDPLDASVVLGIRVTIAKTAAQKKTRRKKTPS